MSPLATAVCGELRTLNVMQCCRSHSQAVTGQSILSQLLQEIHIVSTTVAIACWCTQNLNHPLIRGVFVTYSLNINTKFVMRGCQSQMCTNTSSDRNVSLTVGIVRARATMNRRIALTVKYHGNRIKLRHGMCVRLIVLSRER